MCLFNSLEWSSWSVSPAGECDPSSILAEGEGWNNNKNKYSGAQLLPCIFRFLGESLAFERAQWSVLFFGSPEILEKAAVRQFGLSFRVVKSEPLSLCPRNLIEKSVSQKITTWRLVLGIITLACGSLRAVAHLLDEIKWQKCNLIPGKIIHWTSTTEYHQSELCDFHCM